MNKKLVIGLTTATLSLGAAVSIGAFNNLSFEVKADQVTDGSVYYYCGTHNSWNVTADNEGVIVDSADPTPIEFTADDTFKFQYGGWKGELNWSNLYGTAKGYFTSSGSDIFCNVPGTYNVFIADGNLYIDLIEENFYLIGSMNEWNVETAKAGTAIPLNGSAKAFTLNASQKFKLISSEGYKGELNLNNLSSRYYSCFGQEGKSTDIVVRHSDDYLISVASNDHNLVLTIEANNPSFGTVYVLDLNGNLLSANPRLHGFDGTIQTDSPGYEMEKVAETKNIYSGSYWDALTKLQFNNGTTYTIEYTASVVDGKCLALDWGYSNEHWTSNTWISLEAAKFIDSYMKFESNHQDDGSHTNECDARYAAAKAAYQAAAFESYRADVCKVNLVVARMQEWAMAHGETFIVTDGVGSFSSFAIPSFESKASDNTALVTTIVALSTVAAAGAFFLLRKKNEE